MSAALAVVLATSACATDDATTTESVTPSETATLDVAALKAQLPDRVLTSGTLTVATNAPFAPMEFRRGKDLVGFDVDLVNAIGEALGIKVDIKQVDFPKLVPEVSAGTYDMGMRGLFDTKEREKQVDMVTYFRAGTQWARRVGTDADPYNACGKKVGAEVATTQLTMELPAKSQACEVVGEKKIDIVTYPSETAAMEGLMRGEVDAVSADSPVTLYASQQSKGKLEPTGHAFDTLPYSFPVAKGSSLGPVLQKVVEHFINSGKLASIAKKWGLERGVVKKSSINAAIN
ncbi:ABC transporter substrate-binding protein [Gordonia phthalatica]|uniref:ABC transporter substrate-binding protein n=1 Tax=Gordonia phthalatica TaxID=1136941 RepID=UPI001D039D32|nr:ABC transporter substrate-binding protein [Gordonia phthalatica]